MTLPQFSHFCYQQIRPIDKKLQYQIQKLTKVTIGATDNVGPSEKESNVPQKTEDLLTYRPNPDMLVSKADETSKVVYISHLVFYFIFTFSCL